MCRSPTTKRWTRLKRFPATKGLSRRWSPLNALAHALKMMREKMEKEQLLVVNLSGRGDKDIFTVHDILKARGEI